MYFVVVKSTWKFMCTLNQQYFQDCFSLISMKKCVWICSLTIMKLSSKHIVLSLVLGYGKQLYSFTLPIHVNNY